MAPSLCAMEARLPLLLLLQHLLRVVNPSRVRQWVRVVPSLRLPPPLLLLQHLRQRQRQRQHLLHELSPSRVHQWVQVAPSLCAMEARLPLLLLLQHLLRVVNPSRVRRWARVVPSLLLPPPLPLRPRLHHLLLTALP